MQPMMFIDELPRIAHAVSRARDDLVMKIRRGRFNMTNETQAHGEFLQRWTVANQSPAQAPD